MVIALGADHAGFRLKEYLKAWLRDEGYTVVDTGTHDEQSVDYPDYAVAVGDAVVDGRAERGVLVCGTGIGISIAANRNPAVRCALVSEPLSARFARTHNDANAIALGARLIGIEMAKACLEAFLTADFAGDRHAARVAKLSTIPQDA